MIEDNVINEEVNLIVKHLKQICVQGMFAFVIQERTNTLLRPTNIAEVIEVRRHLIVDLDNSGYKILNGLLSIDKDFRSNLTYSTYIWSATKVQDEVINVNIFVVPKKLVNENG